MGFTTDNVLTLTETGTTCNFWAGVFVGEFGPVAATAIDDLLEELGLRPYESGKPPKIRAEHSAPIKYTVRGQ